MNPEFKRLLWANVNWQRLVFVPLLSLLILYLNHSYESDNDFLPFYFLAFTTLWGCGAVLVTLGEDYRSKTWCWQMMLPLSAWRLFWGKFVSALIFPWLGGLIVLSPLIFSIDGLQIIIIGLLSNTTAAFLAMTSLRKNQLPFSSSLLFILIAFVISALPLSYFYFNDDSTIFWYHWQVSSTIFSNVSILLYIIWQVLACWQLMARKKNAPPKPLGWLIFLIFHVVYVNGFNGLLDYTVDTWLIFSQTATLVLLSCTYLSVFLHDNRSQNLKPLLDAVFNHNKHNSGYYLTSWFLSLTLAFIVAIVATIGEIFSSSYYGNPVLVFCILTFRDVCIVLLFTSSTKNRFGELIALIILAVIHILIPPVVKLFSDEQWLPLSFVDALHANGWVFFISLVQATLAITLLYRQQYRKQPN